jgi:hypothetical protein
LNKQTLVVIAVAVILFAVAIGASLAFIGGDDSDDNVHTMPGGQTMTEPMETSPDMGDQMP